MGGSGDAVSLLTQARKVPGILGGSGTVALWGASSLVTSVQFGSIAVSAATTATATITAVDTSRALIFMLGCFHSAADANQAKGRARVALTNSTTVTATVNTAPTPATTTVKFCVIEVLPGIIRSIQAGTITGASTATITAVDVNKTFLIFLGYTTAITTGECAYAVAQTLTNSTTITQTEGISQTNVGGYMAVELF